MKTGRRRKKSERPESPKPAPAQPSRPKASPTRARAKRASAPARTSAPASSTRPSRRSLIVLPILIGLMVLFVGGVICGRSCLGPKVTPATYLPATAEGSWNATVELVVPSVTVQERFRLDCEADPDCTVIPGTCWMRQREADYTERVVDDYDDYAYNIYYEEAEDRLYESAGTSFVVTQLNPPADWWEGDRHYYAEEWLDQETCQYTNYTVWITDPEDPEYEIEVVLSECEVWDHVVVKERVYGEEEYCRTENVEALEVLDAISQQGIGTGVEWPRAVAPADGALEREFEGTVIFRADGAERVVKTRDLDQYLRYLTIQYYLGLDEDGEVVDLTDQAPD